MAPQHKRGQECKKTKPLNIKMADSQTLKKFILFTLLLLEFKDDL
jgi:hypothetical protein